MKAPSPWAPVPPCLSEARLPAARRCLCRLPDRLWARAGPGAGLQAAPGWTVVGRRPESLGGVRAGGRRRLRESPGGGFPQKPPQAAGPVAPGDWPGRSGFVDPDGLEMRSSAQGVPSRAWKCFKGPGAGSGSRVTRERSLPPPASRRPPGPAAEWGPLSASQALAPLSPCQILIKRILIMINGGGLAAWAWPGSRPTSSHRKAEDGRSDPWQGHHTVLGCGKALPVQTLP